MSYFKEEIYFKMIDKDSRRSFNIKCTDKNGTFKVEWGLDFADRTRHQEHNKSKDECKYLIIDALASGFEIYDNKLYHDGFDEILDVKPINYEKSIDILNKEVERLIKERERVMQEQKELGLEFNHLQQINSGLKLKKDELELKNNELELKKDKLKLKLSIEDKIQLDDMNYDDYLNNQTCNLTLNDISIINQLFPSLDDPKDEKIIVKCPSREPSPDPLI